jgi:hypothetical protein
MANGFSEPNDSIDYEKLFDKSNCTAHNETVYAAPAVAGLAFIQLGQSPRQLRCRRSFPLSDCPRERTTLFRHIFPALAALPAEEKVYK